MALRSAFVQHLAQLRLGGSRAVVAVSGGLDSLVLLDLLVATQNGHGLDLVLAHVDHGIHPDSAVVAERMRQLAAAYGLPCEIARLELGTNAGETIARLRRYERLEQIRLRQAADLIFTAHHGDDQIETVLMRVFEGSGPAGLAAMRARQGAIVRPLLPYRRRELEAYAVERGLEYWDDPANRDPKHLRSWIRVSLLPQLRHRLPEVEERLLRLGTHAAADRDAWEAVIDTLQELNWREESDGASVALAPLLRYDQKLSVALLMAIARRARCVLGPRRAAQVLAALQSTQSGARLEAGSGWLVELTFGRLRFKVAGGPVGAVVPEPCVLSGGEGQCAWGAWLISWKQERAPGDQQRDGLTAWFIPQELRLRQWAPGDRVRPLRGSGHRLVVRCFQDAQIPRSRRSGWPVMTAQSGVVWVPGVCRSQDLLPAANTEALRVDVAHR